MSEDICILCNDVYHVNELYEIPIGSRQFCLCKRCLEKALKSLKNEEDFQIGCNNRAMYCEHMVVL